MAGILCDNINLECIMAGNDLIAEVWRQQDLVYQYDCTAPTLTITAPAGTAAATPSYYTAGAVFRVQGTVIDTESGVAAVYVNNQPATVSGTSWYKDVTLPANTTTSLSVYAVDHAENRTETMTRYVMYDNAAPVLTVSAPAGQSAGAPTYVTNGSYRVSGTVSDSGSGVAAVYVNHAAATISGSNWYKDISLSGDVTTTISVYATDRAGKSSAAVNRYIRYDSAAPSVAISSPAANSYTSATTVTVSGTASDPSGITKVTVNGQTATGSTSWSRAVSLTANAWNTITVIATDAAGRTSTVTRQVYSDTIAPTLSITAPAANSYTTSSTVTVTGACSDATGIRSVTVNGQAASVSNNTYSRSISLNANVWTTLTVVATDGVGRTTTQTRKVFYDSAAPSLALSAPIAESYTSATTTTVSGTVSDASGIRSVTVAGTAVSITNGAFSRSVSLSANAWNTLTVVATDNAGRTSTVSRRVYCDTTAPSLSISAPANNIYTTSSSITVKGTASDATGIRSVTVNGSAASGTTSWSRAVSLSANAWTTITVVATDGVGRTSSATRKIFYDSAAPSLAITSPAANSTVTSSSITVSGTCSDASGIRSVTVNGSAASVSGGTYSKAVSLSLGSNTITVIATDNAGRTSTVSRTVTRISALKVVNSSSASGLGYTPNFAAVLKKGLWANEYEIYGAFITTNTSGTMTGFCEPIHIGTPFNQKKGTAAFGNGTVSINVDGGWPLSGDSVMVCGRASNISFGSFNIGHNGGSGTVIKTITTSFRPNFFACVSYSNGLEGFNGQNFCMMEYTATAGATTLTAGHKTQHNAWNIFSGVSYSANSISLIRGRRASAST